MNINLQYKGMNKMEKRNFLKLGISTSLLGYGCMRFPTKDGRIDEAESEKLLDRAYEAGVNYFDTAYPYHGGESEGFTGRVLAKYPRESYYIATKLPGWEIKSLEDAKRIFNDQLERLGMEYVDFYLLHSMSGRKYREMRELGVVKYCEELKAQGKIRWFGFSFHDSFDAFEEIITDREWDFCQIQLNYMDTEEQAGIRGYELAQRLGVPVIVMEPVKGGSLAKLPDEIYAPLEEYRRGYSPAAWALRWVGTFPNVKVILSGMSDMAQVEDNLRTFNAFEPLNDEEKKLISDTAESLRTRVNNGCTGCNYCMPCPAGVNIPKNFSIWNKYGIYENAYSLKWEWNNDIDTSSKAAACIGCGKCEKLCPQKISIRNDLAALNKEIETVLAEIG